MHQSNPSQWIKSQPSKNCNSFRCSNAFSNHIRKKNISTLLKENKKLIKACQEKKIAKNLHSENKTDGKSRNTIYSTIQNRKTQQNCSIRQDIGTSKKTNNSQVKGSFVCLRTLENREPLAAKKAQQVRTSVLKKSVIVESAKKKEYGNYGNGINSNAKGVNRVSMKLRYDTLA